MLTGRRLRRHARHVLAIDQDAAGARPLEAGEQAQQRRLAAAGRPQQREELVGADLERYLVDRGDLAEPLARPLDADDRRVRHPSHAFGRPAGSGRCSRIAITVRSTVTTISTVEAALTSGVAPNRTME